MAAYPTPAGTAEAEIREKGSRFLAVISPADGEEAAKAGLAAVARRFPDATHHCWAWRVGTPPRERSSDAGEPAGTAGVPILQVLRGAGLSDVLAVVVRWFGGTKLGKGGLARAYAAAAREALQTLPVATRVPTARLALQVPYERVGAVKRLIHPPAVELLSEEYGSDVRGGIGGIGGIGGVGGVLIVLVVQEERHAALREALANLGIPLP